MRQWYPQGSLTRYTNYDAIPLKSASIALILMAIEVQVQLVAWRPGKLRL